MKTNATTLFVSVAAAGIALGAPAPKERADAAFNALFDEGGFAYMQCAFAQHGETRYAFTRKADDAALATNKNTRLKNLNAPFDADTPLHVASVTKVVTAVLLVQLAEEGKLSLRDPVKRHVPLFPDDKVLILHLMTHTSGWRNKTGHSREPKQAEKFYTTLFKEAEIEERFQYMSQGYDILAEIVERVSGADDVADVAAARIFEPLGMAHTTLAPHQGQSGMRTTAGDLVRLGNDLLHSLLKRETGVLTPEGADLLFRPVLKPQFHRTPAFFIHSGEIGFGQYFADCNSMSAVGHAGATGCYFLLDPGLDAVEVILSDGSDIPFRSTDQNFSRMNAIMLGAFGDHPAPVRPLRPAAADVRDAVEKARDEADSRHAAGENVK